MTNSRLTARGAGALTQPGTLPAGVQMHPLQSHPDQRGDLTEVFREEWGDGVEPVQWNMLRSAAGVLRGVHVHVVHDDVVIPLDGRMTLGLRDVRESSPTHGLAVALELSGAAPAVVVIPHGVIHGFLFHESTTLLIGTTSYYDPADDYECLWSDPELDIAWPAEPIVMSDRDRDAPPFSGLLERIRPWQPFGDGASGSEASAEQADDAGMPAASGLRLLRVREQRNRGPVG